MRRLALILLALAPSLAYGDVFPDFSSDPDALVVSGELTIAERREVTTLHVTPAGKLTLKPGAEIVILDRPIDESKDPAQHGHGLLVEGVLSAIGASKTPFVRAAAEPRAGDKTLTLEKSPAGWLVGDTLLVPHSRQPRAGEPDYNWNEYVKIAAVDGATITLAAPLAHDHPAAYGLDGEMKILPHVANMTRDVVIRSENPRGVRGHVMLTMYADVEIRNVAFLDLGRTTAEPLDNTEVDRDGAIKHSGKNHLGRYGGPHFHHLVGPRMPQPNNRQYTLTGCVVDGGDAWLDIKLGSPGTELEFAL